MEETKNEIKELVSEFKEYINLRTKLAELQIKNAAAELIANMATSVTSVLFLSMTFLFGSLALGFYLSKLFQDYATGFSIVGGIYFLLALIILLFKRSIKEKISNSIISQLFKEIDNE